MKTDWFLESRITLRKVALPIEDRQLMFGLVLILLVATISILLTLQGWKSRIPPFDLLTYIYSIRDFVETGTLPQHGDTGSYASYKPAGTAWLMLPSTLLFEDPRLSEYVGTGLLHVFALLGLFLLARQYFGAWCAYLAVLLYGLSAHALFFAGSLWPNGRPDFYILLVFSISQWVTNKDGRYLAAALAVWGIAMQVDMAVTPAFFIFPALWLYYRPPVRPKPLLIAGAVILMVWFPYLRFEAARGFVDIRSQLLQGSIFPANYKEVWCEPELTLQKLEDTPGSPLMSRAQTLVAQNNDSGRLNVLFERTSALAEKLISNFQGVAPIPGASIVLLLLTLVSLLMLSVPGAASGKLGSVAPSGFRRHWSMFLAAGMIFCGLLIIEPILAPILGGERVLAASAQLSKMRELLVLGGLALLVGPWIAVAANQVLVRMGAPVQSMEQAEGRRLLIFCLLIPWLILLLVAEPGKPERFSWIWPLQILFLAAFVTKVLPRLGVPRPVMGLAQILLIVVIVGNSFLMWRVNAWAESGWAGPDAEEIQVVDYVTSHIKAEGRGQAAIGYQIFIYPFMANYHITNPQYKAGAEFDLLFFYRHGVVNTNRCAEGIAADDDYRIVQTRPKPPDWAPRHYFDAPLDDHFRLLAEIESYKVYKRD